MFSNCRNRWRRGVNSKKLFSASNIPALQKWLHPDVAEFAIATSVILGLPQQKKLDVRVEALTEALDLFDEARPGNTEFGEPIVECIMVFTSNAKGRKLVADSKLLLADLLKSQEHLSALDTALSHLETALPLQEGDLQTDVLNAFDDVVKAFLLAKKGCVAEHQPNSSIPSIAHALLLAETQLYKLLKPLLCKTLESADVVSFFSTRALDVSHTIG